MQKIATPKGTKDIISKYPFVFQKKFGQNFLIDPNILDKIITSSNITKEDTVLEIGPGIGSMTQAILENAKEVISVEIDKQLIPILTEQFKNYDNFKLVHNDILKVNILDLLPNSDIKVIANLPYYITTPIIMKLLEEKLPINSITIMVQKEVAQRFMSLPNNKNYGAITLAINFYCDVEFICNVPRACFMPIPNVDSAVIKLNIYKRPPIDVSNTELLFKIIKLAFGQRRKTLVNSLSSEFSKDKIREALIEMNLDINIRGEALSLKEYSNLINLIEKN
ncbi:16S rRNA (adenine(1518)-N(6)/adenine(1519)-N(6))-dimethyltransferase [Candidatus Epulonipiscium fishelsonii]|uniref:16S rRNA (Adenine(1518)-N(6)/adenine(1519)-N(6))-dimethyltransferase n=1 Tax=Candidatus Epulonipiscium fishelsonii TaxID=77094 RepID=A0ACC8X866_9FIRM|nr:16S rRNA (adenine(1518)-N(6)/adenine(1519)-N(6))-dimethyltransferase [Epulopiscium sp. SCG-B11WGA-EpuloA1]ONI43083.1 16S rRNA (adenine(1518)-N(6)/adenine(1519)-N(6))-dimethyltransferase [Epulopiscium sp. SCG-B05WGA-EpuloA1]